MFATARNRIRTALLDGADLALEFATLGEYRLDDPIAACPNDGAPRLGFDPVRARGDVCLADAISRFSAASDLT